MKDCRTRYSAALYRFFALKAAASMGAKRASLRLITCCSVSCICALALSGFQRPDDGFCLALGPPLPIEPRREGVENSRQVGQQVLLPVFSQVHDFDSPPLAA